MTSGKGVAAVVLAAGRSVRMGGPNKLVTPIDGVPMIRKTVMAAMRAPVSAVAVVTGYDAGAVRAALEGLDVALVSNPSYYEGLATSLREGIAAVSAYAGVLVCLGDMPWVKSSTLAALVGAHAPGRIAVPMSGGQRGNPVLWDSAFFPQLQNLSGDRGARELLGTLTAQVTPVAVDDEAIFRDIDTPTDLLEPAPV
jgi:molybdenum cofactor cytidylyltransferase